MAALMKMLTMVLMAVVPGGLLVLTAFVLARIFAHKVRAVKDGPHRYRRALAAMTVRDVMNETRRSLHQETPARDAG
jgi:hypothetical protein